MAMTSEYDRLMARFSALVIEHPFTDVCPELYAEVVAHAEEHPEDTETLETLIEAFSLCARGMHSDDPIHPVRTPETGSALGVAVGLGLVIAGGWFLVKRK